MHKNTKPLKLDPFTLKLDQVSLIEASAGSGKTYNIVNLYLRLLLQLGDPSLSKAVKAKEILLVTFTRAATAEMRKRIEDCLSNFNKCLIKYQEISKVDLLEQVDFTEIRDLDSLLKNLTTKSLITSSKKKALAIRNFNLDDSFYEKCIFQLLEACIYNSTSSVEDKRVSISEAIEILGEELKNKEFSILTIDAFCQGMIKKFSLFSPYSSFSNEKALKDFTKKAFREVMFENFYKENDPEFQQKIQDLNFFDFSFEGQEVKKLIAPDFFFKKDSFTNASPKIYSFIDSLISKYNLEDMLDFANGLWARVINKPLEREFLLNTDISTLLDIELAVDNKNSEEKSLERFNRWLAYLAVKVYHKTLFYSDLEKTTDFSGYQRELLSLLREKDSVMLRNIRNEYSFAIIDEFQDTSPRQLEIFRTIFTGHSQDLDSIESQDSAVERKPRGFIMIGDPKQAIYSFRGADIFSYLEAKKKYTDAVYSISDNYRSSPNFIKSTNLLFLDQSDGFLLDNISYSKAGVGRDKGELKFGGEVVSPITLTAVLNKQILKDKKNFTSVNEYSPLATIVDFMVAFGKEGLLTIPKKIIRNGKEEVVDAPVLASDICFLERQNRNIVELDKAFSTTNVYLNAERSLSTESGAFQGLLYLIKSIINPQSAEAVNQYIFSIISGLTFKDAQNLIQDNQEYSYLIQRLKDYKTIWEEESFLSMITKVIIDNKLLTSGTKSSKLFSVTQDLFTFITFIINNCKELNSPRDLLYYLENFDVIVPEEEKESGLRTSAIEGQDAVNAMTFHKSKGLEFPIVFSNSLVAENKFNLEYPELKPQVNDAEPLDFFNPNNKDDVEFWKKVYQSDNARLYYVALTRAEFAFFATVPQKVDVDLPTYTMCNFFPKYLKEVFKNSGISNLDNFLAEHKDSYFYNYDTENPNPDTKKEIFTSYLEQLKGNIEAFKNSNNKAKKGKNEAFENISIDDKFLANFPINPYQKQVDLLERISDFIIQDTPPYQAARELKDEFIKKGRLVVDIDRSRKLEALTILDTPALDKKEKLEEDKAKVLDNSWQRLQAILDISSAASFKKLSTIETKLDKEEDRNLEIAYGEEGVLLAKKVTKPLPISGSKGSFSKLATDYQEAIKDDYKNHEIFNPLSFSLEEALLEDNCTIVNQESKDFVEDGASAGKVLSHKSDTIEEILINLPRGKEFGDNLHRYLEYNLVEADALMPLKQKENLILHRFSFDRIFRDYSEKEKASIKAALDNLYNYPLLDLDLLRKKEFLSSRDWLLANKDNPNAIEIIKFNPVGNTFRLNNYIRDQSHGHISEWEFSINLKDGDQEGFNITAFLETLAKHQVISYSDDINSQFSHLPTFAKGSFTGLVDLIAFTDQEIIVIDYKTNKLGHRDVDSLTDYSQLQLFDKMLSSGYILQQYIYLTAVYSFLKMNIFKDNPEILQDISFVGLHIFIRGMLADQNGKYYNSGVYSEVPSYELLEDLSKQMVPYLRSSS